MAPTVCSKASTRCPAIQKALSPRPTTGATRTILFVSLHRDFKVHSLTTVHKYIAHHVWMQPRPAQVPYPPAPSMQQQLPHCPRAIRSHRPRGGHIGRMCRQQSAGLLLPSTYCTTQIKHARVINSQPRQSRHNPITTTALPPKPAEATHSHHPHGFRCGAGTGRPPASPVGCLNEAAVTAGGVTCARTIWPVSAPCCRLQATSARKREQ